MNTTSYGCGYGEAGASQSKRALKGFTAQSLSAYEDIDFHNATLRPRARMLYMSSPMATSAIRTNRTNVIGCGLKLKSRIDRAVLKMTTDQADQWEKQTETKFALWADKKQNCDATGINDFYSMQQLCYMSYMMSGDCFALVKHVTPTVLAPYGLRLHIIEADRVSTPAYIGGKTYTPCMDPLIHDGVEVDNAGAIKAYHVCSTHPESVLSPIEKAWVRVEAYGKQTGLPNILHIMSSERPEQYRGVSFLSHVIEPLLQLRRYSDSELTAAIIESYFTGFVKKPEADGLTLTETGDSISDDERDYELGPGTMNYLGPGEDVVFAEPHRPANGFSAFTKAIAEQVGAALEIPSDLLLKAFNASYSASRAALLEAWKSFKMYREWFTNDFCRPVYEIWLSEAVASGHIHAPGFFSDPYIRAAWLGSEWIGPSQGQLDPVKEITAETLAIAQGISTREQSTVRVNGGSWDSNIEQLTIENKLLAQANGVLQVGEDSAVTDMVKMVLSETIKEILSDEKWSSGDDETVLEHPRCV